ncbi:L-erythro-3,5-diaminohexanoate dehydrogenase [Goodfellowiella coeruleoviolacea]|uniref:L-erythro-3,5-diaminohexanoate dehydrogenase n=1 Tax=Goodfellowiella coeruleoviolacea TaxID=334858 RepID=A0AAE3GG68_9PSEU|nr:L-erythro-3,5-diaminohexanoate dehydrogenase [Goodfellowiella coeruleoviolacea]MCP2167530.1 L-erythro-3,5-diaminohexanoate dehydrogenase [Goodfellowiella coeruleoviolacea]
MDASLFGVHRVRDAGPGARGPVLPQQAWALDATPDCGPTEVLVDVTRLNLDAASYRQLREEHGTGPALRQAVCAIVEQRGKMHNPVTGSGGMLLGTVRETGPDSPLGLRPGQRIATLVSLTLTPLRITDGLRDWDGQHPQVPCAGTAVLFARSIATPLPTDLPDDLALAVFDVCGAPALTDRVITQATRRLGHPPSVCVLGASGKSGTLALAAARRAGTSRLVGLVPTPEEATLAQASGLADQIVVADARDPLAVAQAVTPACEITVVCVDAAGCEHGAILATAPGGTVIFFSMATSFSAAALGAEGLAADVEMLIGNGYVPGHAQFALDLLRTQPGVAAALAARERQTAPA